MLSQKASELFEKGLLLLHLELHRATGVTLLGSRFAGLVVFWAKTATRENEWLARAW